MWNKFEVSSSEDETLGNSFYTAGLFKISSDEQSTKNPRVHAAFQNKKILVSVDKSLIFLEDQSTDDVRFLSFSSEIDCFAVSRSGDLMVCCLSDGNIHGVHIKGIPMFNLTIHEADINAAGSFLDIVQLNDEFTIMCANGKIYKVRHIDYQMIGEVASRVADASYEFNDTTQNAAELNKITATKLADDIKAFSCVQTYDGEFYIACGGDWIYFVTTSLVDRIKYPENVSHIKKIFKLENYVLGLTATGEFVEICPYTQTVRLIKHQLDGSPSIFEDLRVLESNDEYNELLVLTAPDRSNERLMMVLDFPSMSCKSELTIPENSWLVSQQKSDVNIYFISGMENDSKFIQTIEVKSIIETDPEQRFKKLLSRGHFDEAEEFAKQFELNLEPLHEARVKKSLLNLHGVKPSSPAFETTFNKLMSQLPAIEDKNFLVTLRLSEIPDRSSMTTFLEYLLKNIDTNHNQNETNEINELLLRLETLRLIDPDECNLQWPVFLYNKDMARVAMDYFKSDILLSCLVWSRHSSSIMPNISFDQFRKWLTTIPSTVEPFQLIQWLKHFAPCFLQLYPKEMTHLVDWCLERTRALQFSNAWPEIGLEFVNNINDIFKDIKFMYVDIRRSRHNNLEKIQQLIFTLEEMSVLKKSYHLTMTLDDYSKRSIEDIAFRLLQRIQMHNLKRLVNDFLYPIFNERGLTPEETLVKYINFLCSNKNLGLWQERAVLSIDLLNNAENRLSSALQVLKVSPVPWSDVVLPLAVLGTSCNHPLANAIFLEYKNQSIKIIKVKYQWAVDYFDLQRDRLKLVLRILRVNNPEMLDDIKTLVKSSPDIAHDAYTYTMHHLVEEGRFDEFVDLVAFIDEGLDSSRVLLEKVANLFTQQVDDDDTDGNFMDATKLLVSQLKSSHDDYNAKHQEELVRKLKNIAKFRRQFGHRLTLKDLDSTVTCKRLFEEAIIEVAAELGEEASIDGVWSKMSLLVETFGFDRIFGFKLLCKKLNNLYVTCHVVDVLCSSIETIEKSDIESALELIVLLIAQQITYYENNHKSNFDNYDPLAFPLTYEFLLKCLPHYDLLHHESLIDLLRWVRIGRSFYPSDVVEETRNGRVLSANIFSSKMFNGNGHHKGNRRDTFSMFDDFEEDKVVVKEQSIDDKLNPVLRCICSSLKAVMYAGDVVLEPLVRIKAHLHEQDDVLQIKDDFFAALENILKMKLYEPVVKIVELLIENQSKTKTLIIPPVFVSNVNKKIIKFLLSQKLPNYISAFRILRSEENRDDCMQYLQGVLKNNSQKIAFSTFCEMYNNFIGNNDNVIDERENRLKFYYCSELAKYDQNIRIKDNIENLSMADLQKDLEKRQLSIDLVKKLSRDFGWDYQKALVQQIKILLRSQELEFDLKNDVFGKEEVIIKTSVDGIRKKCSPYLHELTNMSLLLSEMNQFYNEVNFYFYEMYLVVLELIAYSKDLSFEQIIHRNVLVLLKHEMTSKRRRIESVEIDEWHSHQREKAVLPGIAKYRLPFTTMIANNLMIYVGEDLNVDTFEKFIPLITLHASLKKEQVEDRIEAFAFMAIKHSVMDLKTKMESQNGSKWNLKPTNNAFLQTVLRMVSVLKDKAKGLAILYYLVSNSPEGSDQVEAAFECWKFAQEHEAELLTAQTKYAELVHKIYKKYPMYKTQHLLHLYGLNEDKLMQLVENPADLVRGLYHHDSILQPQKKDINKLCGALAKLYGLDLLTLQHKLLHKWLAFVANASFDEADMNETMYEDYIGNTVAGDDEQAFISDESVARAHYILSSWANDKAMGFLASELGSNCTSPENQLQLYECFAKLIDDDSSSYMDLIKPTNYLLIKSCHYLKQFGLNLKPDKFNDLDKVDLLKKLWVSHYNSSKGLEVMSFICLGFSIHLPQIWNGVLKQMVALKMIDQLSILVEILSTQSKLLHLPNLKLAWECVITEPFMHATKACTYEQDQNLAKAFILLQKCPISTFLNLEGLIAHCMRLERPWMAAIFVAFVNEKNREQYVKMLDPFDKREMKKNIVELEEMGVAPIITGSAINILKLLRNWEHAIGRSAG